MSNWSNPSVASTAELTSDDGITSPTTRESSPSPPLPPTYLRGPVPILQKPMVAEPTIVEHNEQPRQSSIPDEDKKFEANVGRKRCITFACGRNKSPAPSPHKKTTSPPQIEKPTETPKRKCMLTFACPTRPSVTTTTPSQQFKARSRRHLSPIPPTPSDEKPATSPKPAPKVHRGSDSTVKNESPKSVRKSPSYVRRRKYSEDKEDADAEARRFHEFGNAEQQEEWVKEATCHRSRLTINDTLQKENVIRKLGEEVEEEVLEEEEDDLEEEDDILDEEDDEDEDEDDEVEEDDDDVVSEGGFQTDDEEGFAVSDSESDGSDTEWWAPGRSTAATSMENVPHIRPIHRRTASESSLESARENATANPRISKKSRKSKAMKINRPVTPELPDSTDFVCGTLDEDRPLEQAYLAQREQKKAAKKKITPQDIDPTFPTSDPELDEEDDDDLDEGSEPSDHVGFMHGNLDLNADEPHRRGRRTSVQEKRKKSPPLSPRRYRSPAPQIRATLRSPPPPKRAVLRSPPPPKRTARAKSPAPPRRLFDKSPPRRRGSPAPIRLTSPPPSRRVSPSAMATQPMPVTPTALAQRPQPTFTASLPRTATILNPGATVGRGMNYFDDDEELDRALDIPSRGAIDIVKGLEKKRQRRKEKLYQKYCKKADKDRRPKPGKGAERMREVGLELAAYKGKKQHMLSY